MDKKYIIFDTTNVRFKNFELTCLLAFITVCETSIKWNIKGDYVIYGKDATLTCNGTSCPLKAIKKWIGGPNYNLLCFDDYSTKPTKYEMMSNDTRPEFDLMIKGFDFGDASCEYTCSCGFLQYTNMLKLDDSNFIYLPDVDEDSSKQNDDTFQIDLVMKVYPLPTCELFYEDNAIPVSLTVKNWSTENDLRLYTGRIQRTIDLRSYKCKGNVSLTCQVRSLKRRLLHQHIDFCKTEDEHHEHSDEYVSKIIISVFGVLIPSATIAFLIHVIYKFVKKKWCAQTGRESVLMALSSLYSNEAEETRVLNLLSSETEATPISNLPSNKAEEITVLNLPSSETEATPISNLPSNEADVTSMFNIPSNEEEANAMLNAHKDNDSVKYKYSSIAKNTHIKENEND